MGDELRDRIARALREHMFGGIEEPIEDGWLRMADAVLAVLPQYDQVGWRAANGTFESRHRVSDERARGYGWVPVFVVRDTTEEEQA